MQSRSWAPRFCSGGALLHLPYWSWVISVASYKKATSPSMSINTTNKCVNENRKKRKRLRWQAANHGCHCFDRAFLLAGACVCCVKIKRLRFLRFSFTQRTQRTQRKRLRLNGNRASYNEWSSWIHKPKGMLLVVVVTSAAITSSKVPNQIVLIQKTRKVTNVSQHWTSWVRTSNERYYVWTKEKIQLRDYASANFVPYSL